MWECALHAPARVAQVRAFAIHALARVAQVWECALHAPARVALDELAVLDSPRALARTPPAADPTASAPGPPAGDFGIVIVGVAFEPGGQVVGPCDQPGVSGVQVAVMDKDSIGKIIAGDGLEVVDRYANR